MKKPPCFFKKEAAELVSGFFDVYTIVNCLKRKTFFLKFILMMLTHFNLADK
jgi:hypothetical protein